MNATTPLAILSACLLACGGDSPAGGPDAASTIDANIDAPSATGDLPLPVDGTQVVSPYITINPGEEATYCYYAQFENGRPLGVQRWESQMTPGSHHVIVYFRNSSQGPVGTVERDCGAGGLGAVWTYSAQTPHQEQMMPEGVGMDVPVGQYATIEMHYLNTSDAPLDARVTLNAHAYPEGTAYQRAAAYITYNTQISVPPGQTSSAGGTCAVPSGSKFFALSTHAHKQATHTQVDDGASMIFASDNWEHPGVQEWLTAPHFEFASGELTYSCDYFNPTDRTVTEGSSAQDDEMCMAVGYFFPANGPKLCVNSQILQ